MDLNFFRASAGSGAKVKPPPPANPQHFPVGNAVPGVPRSSTEPKQAVRRIRIHPCRARRPRRAAQQRPRFPQLRANPQHFPVGNVRYPPTLGEFATGQRIRPRFSASYRVLHGKGKPFPYNRRLRIRRTWYLSLVLLRGAPGRRALQENPTNSSGVAVIHSFSYLRVSQSALSRSLPQRGRVSPTRATGEGERDGTATWK